MTTALAGPALSPRRAILASFAHAYAIALQRRRCEAAIQFIVRTGDPLQPHRTSDNPPQEGEQLLALIL